MNPALDEAIDRKFHLIGFSPSAEYFIASTPDRSTYKMFSKAREVFSLSDLDQRYSDYLILPPTDSGVLVVSGDKDSGRQDWEIIDAEASRSIKFSFSNDSVQAVSSAGGYAVLVYRNTITDELRCRRINPSLSIDEDSIILSPSPQDPQVELVVNSKGTVLLSLTDNHGVQRIFSSSNGESGSSFLILPLEKLPESIARELSKRQLILDGLSSTDEVAFHLTKETGSGLFRIGDTRVLSQLPFRVAFISQNDLFAPSEPESDPAIDKQQVNALKQRGVNLRTVALMNDGTRLAQIESSAGDEQEYTMIRGRP